MWTNVLIFAAGTAFGLLLAALGVAGFILWYDYVGVDYTEQT